MTQAKITNLTYMQIHALTNGLGTLDLNGLKLTKTTATFAVDPGAALNQVKALQAKLATTEGRRGGDYQALHGVARKLRLLRDA